MTKKIIGVLLISSCFSVALAAQTNKFDEFLSVLARVESSNDPKAFNKRESAVGIYQIRAAYFEDAKYFDKTLSNLSHNDCFNPEISKRVVMAYMLRYEKNSFNNNDFYSMAMSHNGGPGWRKANKQKKNNLEIYWRRFQSRK